MSGHSVMLPLSFGTLLLHPLSPHLILEHCIKSATSLGCLMTAMSRALPVCRISVREHSGGVNTLARRSTRELL
jgi:hypothetical protein